MKPPSRVVELELNVAAKRTSTRTVLPPILQTVRQHAKRQIGGLMETLFNSIDDALFEMADRSQSDADQNTYFEAMREIRIKREQLISSWATEFEAGFEAIFDERAAEPEVELVPVPDAHELGDGLSLVNNDDLEVSVANAGIVSKVTGHYSQAVVQLTKRIDHLCSVQIVTDRLNPLGPQHLASAFSQAIDVLDVDIKIKLILIKLYERFVMERLGDVYEHANRLLAEAGVLPDLRGMIVKSRTTSQRKGRGAGPHSGGEPTMGPATPAGHGFDAGELIGEDAGFGVIQRLLARTRASGNSGVPGTYTSAAGGSGGAGDGSGGKAGVTGGGTGRVGSGPAPGTVVMPTHQLLSVLSTAQQEVSARPLDITSAPAVVDLRQLVLDSASEPSSMGQADDDVVNFVGMLFDYILNDRNLAIPMKALIARLQIPIVKLAVLDKSFFEKTSHPARQLLNTLSSAGIGWSSAKELKRDALYNKIESVVLRVLNGNTETPALFEALVDELQRFISKDERRNSIVEQRVKETESGKARSEAAKQDVQQLINQKAAGMRLPTVVGRFVSDTWSKLLVYIAVTSGLESDDWQSAVATLDDLLWSMQPLESVDDLERREGLRSRLLGDVERGVGRINMPESDAAQLLEQLNGELETVAEHDRAMLLHEEEPEPMIGDYQGLCPQFFALSFSER